MKRVYSVVGLLLLFVVAAFVPVLFWVYVGVGGFLVAAVFVRDHFVARRPVGVDACFFGSSGRMRRFMRRANVGELRFWRLQPSKRLLLVFVGVSVAALLVLLWVWQLTASCCTRRSGMVGGFRGIMMRRMMVSEA